MRTLRAVLTVICGATALFGQAATPGRFDLFAHFDTSMGEMVAQLFPERTPVAVENFINLAEGKKATFTRDLKFVHRPYYNGLEFHRVIKGFMIQAGVVKDGVPCGAANIHDEFDTARSFAQPFALAMANAGHPNSSACQFFITVAPQKPLDGSYTLFGQLVSGQDVAESISEVPVKKEKPITPVIIRKVTIERRPR